MLEGIVQWYRNWMVGNAIQNCNLEHLAAALSKPVDFSRFSRSVQEETYEVMTYSRDITSVLELALECDLPAEGFAMLVQAGAPFDAKVCKRLSQRDPNTYPEAASAYAILQRQQLDLAAPQAEAVPARRPRI